MYQDNALTEMMNGGGIEDVTAGLESPGVVIGRDTLK